MKIVGEKQISEFLVHMEDVLIDANTPLDTVELACRLREKYPQYIPHGSLGKTALDIGRKYGSDTFDIHSQSTTSRKQLIALKKTAKLRRAIKHFKDGISLLCDDLIVSLVK